MPQFVSWRPMDFVKPDIENWKQRKFTYFRDGGESRKAFWVFDLDQSYRPAVSPASYILVHFDFGEQNGSVITAPENHIDFEATGSKKELEHEVKELQKQYGGAGLNGMEKLFHGEARHPSMVIVKKNEPGAYGIGWMIRRHLTIKKIRLATMAEYKRALGKDVGKDYPKQEWRFSRRAMGREGLSGSADRIPISTDDGCPVPRRPPRQTPGTDCRGVGRTRDAPFPDAARAAHPAR